MKRLTVIASAILLASTVLQASPSKRGAPPPRSSAPSAPVPDFWYVVPDDTPPSDATTLARGIVVPSTVRPTVQTTPTGSVISWSRPDGTRQSFAVQGVSSIRFEPGPIDGTTYVPFGGRKHLQYDPDRCCSCASWENSVESVEALSCVIGCVGCGCEGCICSPTYPCPVAAPGDMILVAHDRSGPAMRFGRSEEAERITFAHDGGVRVGFRGERLGAKMTPDGLTAIIDPDSIALPGAVETSAAIRGDRAFFAWSSPEASVILEQPRSMPPPSFRDGVIDFDPERADPPPTTARRLEVNPVTDRCKVCGTHPNSTADLDIYDCVPGFHTCWRCVTFECVAAGS